MDNHWKRVIGQIPCSHMAHFKLEYDFIWGLESTDPHSGRGTRAGGTHRLGLCKSHFTHLLRQGPGFLCVTALAVLELAL